MPDIDANKVLGFGSIPYEALRKALSLKPSEVATSIMRLAENEDFVVFLSHARALAYAARGRCPAPEWLPVARGLGWFFEAVKERAERNLAEPAQENRPMARILDLARRLGVLREDRNDIAGCGVTEEELLEITRECAGLGIKTKDQLIGAIGGMANADYAETDFGD